MIDLAKIKDDLKRDEGLRLKPYEDSMGKMTIGIGRNLDDVGITADEADFLLTHDIGNAIGDLDNFCPWWKNLNEPRQRALVNMCFNIGIHRLLGFKDMLSALREGNYEDASNQALDSKWAKQVGKRARLIAMTFVIGK